LLLVFLIFLAAYRDRDYVASATSSKLTTWTGDQDDAIALALASNMTAADLDISEMAVARYRCYYRLVHSHILKIHGFPLQSIGSGKKLRTKYNDGIDLGQSTQTAGPHRGIAL
jgi:hypothetical protein